MGLYLTHFSYAPEAWAAMIRDPHDRRELLRPVFEQAGARLIDMYYSFGMEDGFALSEGDAVSAAAISAAVAASGSISHVRTTMLLTVDEMLDALRRAQSVTYVAPAARTTA